MVELNIPGQHPRTYDEVMRSISTQASAFNVPVTLAYAIAWVESKFRPLALGDWIYPNGAIANPGDPGAHPRSIGIYQLNREGGLGSGIDLQTLADPFSNAYYALSHLAETPNPGNPGMWAAESQNPGNWNEYAQLINQAIATKPWEMLTPTDISNNPGTFDPGNLPPVEVLPSPIPGRPPIQRPVESTPLVNTTGSNLPDWIVAEPTTIATIPFLGDITLNTTPLINWGLRMLITVLAAALIVYGLIKLAEPVQEVIVSRGS